MALAVKGGSLSAVRALLGAKSAVAATNAEKDTALHFADSLETVSALLAANADASAPDLERYTPLHLVARLGVPAAVKAMLESKADARALTKVTFVLSAQF